MAKKTKRVIACAHNGNPRSIVSDYTRQSKAIWRRRRKQAHFLRSYRETRQISTAARLVGINIRTLYDWEENDPVFAAHMELARQEYSDYLEAEAVRRAVEGVEKPVVSAGRLVTTTTEYSDALLQTLLRANNPQKFNPKIGMGMEIKKDEDGQPMLKSYVGVDLERI